MFEIVSKTKIGAEIATLAEAKIWFRSEESGGVEDALISGLIEGAREEIERLSGRSLVASNITVYAKDWTGFLPYPPLASVTTVIDFEGVKMPYVSVAGDGVEIDYVTEAYQSQSAKNAVLDLAFEWYKRGGERGMIPDNIKKVIDSFSLRRSL